MAKIFLSSTSEDLKDHRAAAMLLLRKAEHSCDAMEFSAASPPPADECRRRVKQCEIYVGILAWRYGTLVPGEHISFTELEYWEAVRNNLECLFFLVDDDQLWLPRH